MKLNLFTLIAVGLCAPALIQASYSFKEPFDQTVAFKPTGEISLENVNGAVEIRTWDRNEVRIEGEKSAKTGEELKLIDLSIDTSPERITIKTRLPKRPGSWFGGTIRAQVRFTVTVPATATLREIENVNGGIIIDGVRGEVKASTVNGKIEVTGLGSNTSLETVNGSINASQLGGNARLETVNGSINASFATLAAQQQLSFETVNGGITVALPKNAGVALQASVVNGGIECDLPLLVKGEIGRRNLKGTIGDGSASLEASSVNGSIHLQSL